MRLIQKQPEPNTLAETRCAATTDLSTQSGARTAFDQLSKPALRAQLAKEQGWLCAFCMLRIDHERTDAHGEPIMKIAHRLPIAVDSGHALEWKNFLGSCDGGQRSGGRRWTCDAAQGSRGLSVDPTDQNSVSRIRYERRDAKTGLFITSDDPQVRADVEETLALNTGDLPELRERAWIAFWKLCLRDGPRGRYGKPAQQAFFPKWFSRGGKLPEMIGVVEFKVRSAG